MITEASRAITEQASLWARWKQDSRTRPPDGRGSAADLSLTLGETAYVAPRVCDLIFTAAPSMPAESWRLRPDDVFVPQGFAYFARPCPLVAALGWALVYNVDTDQEIAPVPPSTYAPLDENDGIWLGVWTLGNLGRLSALSLNLMWRIGESLKDAQLKAAVRAAEGVSDDEIRTAQDRLRIAASFFAFVQQRVVARERTPGDRTSRRRAEDAGLTTRDCQIVLLRRAAAHRDSQDHPDAEPVSWSCRWWVGGHWRQQPCGEGRAERRPTWISPYLKGPEDKPVLASRRLFIVAR